MRSRPARRLWLAVALVAGTAALFWLTSWLLDKGNDGAGIANVLALPVAVLGSVAAFAALRSRPETDDRAILRSRAITLLGQVIKAESRALQQLLGDTGHPEPADIGFVRTPPNTTTPPRRPDGGTTIGSLNTVAEFYEDVAFGRLVVLGEPGSGKTVLLIRLLLDLGEKAHAAPDDERIRIPVKLSLPSFADTRRPIIARERLEAWIAEEITDVYGVPKTTAKALVTGGWILPILDGLDEMDGDSASAHRAAEVIAALNTAGGFSGWPVVVACRSANYEKPPLRLQDAESVTMKPLGTDQIIRWLSHRFPGSTRPDGVQARWRPVVTRIRTNPTGRLAKFLSSPLHLYLAVNVFQGQADGLEPRELCDFDKDDLKDFLHERLIPAAVEHHPGPEGTPYRAEEVRVWLSTFANHLAWMGTQGYSRTDIHLHELWRTVGDPARHGRNVRLGAAALVTGLITFLLLLLFLRAWFFSTSSDLRANPERWFLIAPVLLGIGTLVFRFTATKTTRALERIEPALLFTRAGRRTVLRTATTWMAIGGLIGLPAGIGASLLSGFGELPTVAVGGVLTFGVFGFVTGLVVGAGDMTTRLEAADRPSRPQRRIRGTIAVQSIIVGLFFLTLGSLPGGVVDGVLFGTAGGLGLFLAGGPTPRLRHDLAIRYLVRRKRLPRRPETFLDWAYDAGLLRLAGTATQFRHREVQERLTTDGPTDAIGAG